MENIFNKIVTSKTVEELVRITTKERDNYQLEAIEAAEKELKEIF